MPFLVYKPVVSGQPHWKQVSQGGSHVTARRRSRRATTAARENLDIRTAGRSSARRHARRFVDRGNVTTKLSAPGASRGAQGPGRAARGEGQHARKRARY